MNQSLAKMHSGYLNKWNLIINQKRITMKNIRILFALSWTLISLGAVAVFGLGDDNNQDKEVVKEKTAQECQIPAFAKAIGHEDQWLLHNGCPPRELKPKNDNN